MVGYDRASLCRLASKIEKYPECAKKLGISIEFMKADLTQSNVSEGETNLNERPTIKSQ